MGDIDTFCPVLSIYRSLGHRGARESGVRNDKRVLHHIRMPRHDRPLVQVSTGLIIHLLWLWSVCFTIPSVIHPFCRMYLWFDEKGKKTRVAAPQYIDYVMTFTQKTVTDETIFPTKYANEFPSSFESIARKILRLLYHVIAHLYAAHFREIVLLGLHTHLNLTFAHLTALHR